MLTTSALPATAPPLLRLQGVARTYALGANRIRALDGIDLRIERGEFVAVWGPSGSGKSTLLHIAGLIDHADQGQVFFDGEDVARLSDDALADFRNHKIGFVFQSFNLVPVLSALENVMLPLQMRSHRVAHAAQARERARAWLAQVGLTDFAAQRPDQLSGGQRQRVAIARALVTEPRLLLADEPTANLDSVTGHDLMELFERLNRDTGVTCVFSTHDPRLLARVPRQIGLRDGRVAGDATVAPPAPDQATPRSQP